MGVKCFKTNCCEISHEKTLRFDNAYHLYKSQNKITEYYSFCDLFEIKQESEKIIPEDDFYYCQISNISKNGDLFPVYLNFCNRDELFESFYKKIEKGDIIKVSEDDILLSFLVPQDLSIIGKFTLITKENSNIFFTKALIRLHPKFNAKLLFYSLRSVLYKDLISISRIKKGYTGYATIDEDDLKRIRFPKRHIDSVLANADGLIAKINDIEQDIADLKNSKKPDIYIINEIFNEEFGFDFDALAPMVNCKTHIAQFTEIANDELKFGVSLRLRYIFRHFIKPMPNINWKPLIKIVKVKGGKRLPKGESVLDEETDYKYIKVEDLNWNGFFDIENIKFISKANHEVIKQYIAETDDILLTIVGATIGKCGLVPEELSGENISENFARLIIRNRKKWIPQYLCYALMSKCSQFQIDEYTGKSSQGKLAIFRVNKILIPEVDTDKQSEIVSKIEQRIYAQKGIDDKIESKRKEIGKLIESVIQ